MAFEPVVFDLEAVDQEVEETRFGVWIHDNSLKLTWYRAMASAVPTFRESIRPGMGIVT
jgi:hypothetical protein